jgi:hypothetical protein
MKSFRSFIVLFTGIIMLSSCSKKNKEIVNTYVNKESATINGAAFVSASTNADVNTVSSYKQLTIDGTSASGDRITIAINNFTGAAGSFSMSGAGADAIGAISVANSTTDVIATSGTAVITGGDTSFPGGVVYSGTFNFTATGYDVTGGSFSVWVIN